MGGVGFTSMATSNSGIKLKLTVPKARSGTKGISVLRVYLLLEIDERN